jgi:hypothetical protein
MLLGRLMPETIPAPASRVTVSAIARAVPIDGFGEAS